MFRTHFPSDFSKRFGLIFGHKVLTKYERKLTYFLNIFLKDLGTILAPEMAPGRGIITDYFASGFLHCSKIANMAAELRRMYQKSSSDQKNTSKMSPILRFLTEEYTTKASQIRQMHKIQEIRLEEHFRLGDFVRDSAKFFANMPPECPYNA